MRYTYTRLFLSTISHFFFCRPPVMRPRRAVEKQGTGSGARPVNQQRAPPVDVHDCPTPQSLFQTLTDDCASTAAMIQKERRRAAVLALPSLRSFCDRILTTATATGLAFSDRTARDAPLSVEELLLAARRAALLVESRSASGTELQRRIRERLASTSQLSSSVYHPSCRSDELEIVLLSILPLL